MNTNIKLLLFLIFMISLISFSTEIQAQNINTYLDYNLQQVQPYPVLKNLNQVSSNQLEITFDTATNSVYAVQPKNYWIQNVNGDTLDQVSSIGKKDKTTNQNCLTNEMVKIKPKNASNKTFIMTFKDDITSNKKYKLIICFVPSNNKSTFNGRNGAITFIGE